MKKLIYLLALSFFSVALYAQNGFQSNSYGLYYEGGNIGIGTTVAEQRLTINGGNIQVTGALAGLNQPSHTYINLLNKGIRGGLHGWKIFTASSAGAWGVGSNAFEVWEYPELSNSSATTGLNLRRLVIQTNRDEKACYPIVIGRRGNLTVGYDGEMQVSDATDLSVKGSVGIGTTDTQGYKLSVNGVIRAKEIKVESNWADFVFDENYALPSLEEVASHIKENKHLPGIPSASEVAEEGVNLGDMNVKLLQKIEELTLYTIRQQEMIDAMQVKIEQLESKIEK